MKWYDVHPSLYLSICLSRCCRFAAVGPAGRWYRLFAAAAAGECGQCHTVSIRSSWTQTCFCWSNIVCVCVWVQCGISCHKKCLSSLQLKCGNPRNFLRSTASGDNEAPRSLLCTIAQCIGEINDRGLSVKVGQLMLTYYNMLNVASAIRFQWRMDFIAYPHKRRQSLKTKPRIKREIGYIFAKYTCVEMASPKTQTYQNKTKNLCTICFVFDLDGECKFAETKHYSN